MNFKACTFERLALIFGFGRGAQVGKTSLLEVNLYGASVDVGRIIFIWYASGPGISSTLGFGRRRSIFFSNAKQDSETTTLLAAVRCCVTSTLAA